MALQLSSLTLEYVKTTVTADVAVTGDDVEMAFPNEYEAPDEADWVTAEWTPGETAEARILVGPGGTTELAPGAYWAWIRVTDNPEIPVRQFDTIYINA